jgi:hypothetical protein
MPSGLAPKGSLGRAEQEPEMNCVACGSAAVTKQPEYAAQDYRWFCCRDCDPQLGERNAGLLSHTQYSPRT